MTNVIFHIGDPKTGSSSIQAAMQGGLVRCEDRSLAYWKTANAMPLAHVLRKKKAADQRDARYAEVGDWLRSCGADHAIVSSENFSEVDPELLYRTLEKHCPDHLADARVIAYVRPHASRVLAAYTQRVKVGRFKGDFEDFKSKIGDALNIDYAPKFRRWRAQFGDRFTLRPFIRGELKDQDVVQDFFALVLGDEEFAIGEIPEVNVGVTLRALSGLRLLQRQLTQAGGRKISGGRLSAAVANNYLPQGPISGEKPRLDRQTVQELIAQCEADAQALDTEFFGRPLMQDALQKSLDQAGETPIDLKPALYFTPAERKRLNTLSEAVKDLVLDDHASWSIFDKADRGQIRLNRKQQKKMANQKAHLGEIERHLAEIAGILRG